MDCRPRRSHAITEVNDMKILVTGAKGFVGKNLCSQLKNIMEDIYAKSSEAAKEYGHEGNYLIGANIAGFMKVADAMMAHGIV